MILVCKITWALNYLEILVFSWLSNNHLISIVYSLTWYSVPSVAMTDSLSPMTAFPQWVKSSTETWNLTRKKLCKKRCRVLQMFPAEMPAGIVVVCVEWNPSHSQWKETISFSWLKLYFHFSNIDEYDANCLEIEPYG